MKTEWASIATKSARELTAKHCNSVLTDSEASGPLLSTPHSSQPRHAHTLSALPNIEPSRKGHSAVWHVPEISFSAPLSDRAGACCLSPHSYATSLVHSENLLFLKQAFLRKQNIQRIARLLIAQCYKKIYIFLEIKFLAFKA